MNEWIDVVLWPCKAHQDASNSSVEPPIIILDAYHVHQMGSVVNHIQSMGIEVHIHAGCTYVCQPIDVRINKPSMCQLCEKWEDWMMEGDGIVDGMAKEPSHKMVVEWLVQAQVYKSIPEEIRRKVWKKKGYKWV
jgi:hypothetical protein